MSRRRFNVHRELTFEGVTARLLQALNLPDHKALAGALDLRSNTYYNRKSAGSIPFEAVIALAEKHGLSLDWVLLGGGSAFIKPGAASVKAMPAAAQQILGEILAELASVFGPSNLAEGNSDRERAAFRGNLTGLIYNKVMRLQNPTQRLKAIRTEALAFASAAALLRTTAAAASEQKTKRSRPL